MDVTFRTVPRTLTEEDRIRETERQLGGRMTSASLSEEQYAAWEAIEKWALDADPYTLFTMGGYAGVGKSTLLVALATELEKQNIAFCAYTGKATGVLRRKFYENNVNYTVLSTLHSLMYFPMVDDRGRITGWGKHARLPWDLDLIVLDEASMIDEKMFRDLSVYGTPILAVGDHGQLPPVFGNFNLMESPHVRLETIHRQAVGSPILELSRRVRQHGYLTVGDNTPEVQHLGLKSLPAVLTSLFQTPNLDLGNVAMLCFTNTTRNWLNEQARRVRWGAEYRPEPRVGDQVICLRNVGARVFNGMRGFITRMKHLTHLHYDMTILFRDDEVEITGPVCKAQFGRALTIRDFDEYHELTRYHVKKWADIGLLFDYGYALTVHKSQGSQYQTVLVIARDLPRNYGLDMKRRSLYTAVTRASKYLVLIH